MIETAGTLAYPLLARCRNEEETVNTLQIRTGDERSLFDYIGKEFQHRWQCSRERDQASSRK